MRWGNVVEPTETSDQKQRFGLMRRFYTHVLNGTEFAKDDEGQQFADLEAACESARRGARRMVSYEIDAGRDPVKLEYHIHDEAGAQLATFPVSATVLGLD